MKTKKQIEEELAVIRKALADLPDGRASDTAYGAQQALCWALGENAQRPSQTAMGMRDAKAH